jgi:cytochrome c oxidase cbb3-type subunit 4
MDLNDVRSIVTLASLLLFIALVAFTWSRSRRAAHDAAAALPFADDAGARNE